MNAPTKVYSFTPILTATVPSMQGFLDHPMLSHIEGNLYVGMSPFYWPEKKGHEDFTSIFNFFNSPKYDYYVKIQTRYQAYTCVDGHEALSTDTIHHYATRILDAMVEGPTLVHCQMGINRSNLFAAAALATGGMNIVKAIALLREKRSKYVLMNKVFERQLLRMYGKHA